MEPKYAFEAWAGAEPVKDANFEGDDQINVALEIPPTVRYGVTANITAFHAVARGSIPRTRTESVSGTMFLLDTYIAGAYRPFLRDHNERPRRLPA